MDSKSMIATYFEYGEKEINYLKARDRRLAEVMEKAGMIKREIISDFFAALVHSIAGQQISTKAHRTVWGRVKAALGEVTPENVLKLTPEELQGAGLSFRKVTYIRSAAQKIISGEFSVERLYGMNDSEVEASLSQLGGVGRWSAQMLMLFSMCRPDILSFQDLGIQRGLRLLYGHKKITPDLFEKYRKRYSPYCSVASLYLWAVAGGEVEIPHICLQHYLSPAGELLLGSIDGRLCMCDWAESTHGNAAGKRLQRLLHADFKEEKSAVTEMAARQLDEYFAGIRHSFELPLLFAGTDFQKKVWNELLNIPYGETASYAAIAERTGMPKAVRAVANANGANALSIIVPCHRVIGSNSTLTGYGGGLPAKKFLLELEHKKDRQE